MQTDGAQNVRGDAVFKCDRVLQEETSSADTSLRFFMFAPLHHDFMLSSLMVSRQMSYSAFCVPPPVPSSAPRLPVLPLLEEAMKEVVVKTTPLPPLQPHRSIF